MYSAVIFHHLPQHSKVPNCQDVTSRGQHRQSLPMYVSHKHCPLRAFPFPVFYSKAPKDCIYWKYPADGRAIMYADYD